MMLVVLIGVLAFRNQTKNRNPQTLAEDVFVNVTVVPTLFIVMFNELAAVPTSTSLIVFLSRISMARTAALVVLET